MIAQINENNEIINFLWGYGYENVPLKPHWIEVKGYDWDMDDERAKRINDKEYSEKIRVKRYTIDPKKGMVHRRTDEEIMVLEEYSYKQMVNKLELMREKEQDLLMWNNIKNNQTLTQAERTYIENKITEIYNRGQ